MVGLPVTGAVREVKWGKCSDGDVPSLAFGLVVMKGVKPKMAAKVGTNGSQDNKKGQ